MTDYIESRLFAYPMLFKHPIDVLEHMFAVNGNGVDSDTFNEYRVYQADSGWTYSTGGFSLDADMFENLAPVSLAVLYPWSDNAKFRPFRKYCRITVESNRLGIISAAKYFVKCLEVTTRESMIERLVLEPGYGHSNIVKSTEYVDTHCVEALKQWKENIQLFKDAFNI